MAISNTVRALCATVRLCRPVYRVMLHGYRKHGGGWEHVPVHVHMQHAASHHYAGESSTLGWACEEAESGLPHKAHEVVRILMWMHRSRSEDGGCQNGR